MSNDTYKAQLEKFIRDSSPAKGGANPTILIADYVLHKNIRFPQWHKRDYCNIRWLISPEV